MLFNELREKISFWEELETGAELEKTVPPTSLKEKKDFESWQKIAFVSFGSNNPELSYKLWKSFEDVFFGSEESTKRDSEYLRALLWYSSLPVMPRREVARFFSEAEIVSLMKEPEVFDLKEKVKSRLALEPLEQRDSWREEIFNSLRQNKSVISRNISTKEGGYGSVENWLKSYDHEIGTGIADSLKRVEFENKAKTGQSGIQESEILALKGLLDFYEYIKYSSYDEEGFEEDFIETSSDGKTYIVSGGKRVLLSKEVQKEENSTNVLSGSRVEDKEQKEAQYNQMPDFRNIALKSKEILENTNGEYKKILDLLHSALEGLKIQDSLGCILLLSELRLLDTVLSDDERFSFMVVEDLKKTGNPDDVAGFRINPRAPQFLARFLKIAFQEKLGISPEESIQFGQRVSRVLAVEGEKYGKMVFGGKWNM